MQIESASFVSYLDYELEIRVGHGHDLLERIRVAAGLHNFYVRKQTHSRGQIEMQKVAKSQSAASTKKSQAIQAYVRNWHKISSILKSSSLPTSKKQNRLKGLQELNGDLDVRIFQENGTLVKSFIPNKRACVSWIWRVAMLDGGELTVDSDFNDKATVWEAEGKYHKFELSLFYQLQFAAWRLHWLHTFSRNE